MRILALVAISVVFGYTCQAATTEDTSNSTRYETTVQEASTTRSYRTSASYTRWRTTLTTPGDLNYCNSDYDVRLVGGNSSQYEGRVEVRCRYPRSNWGTVCDDDWGLSDARVVCRMLGYQDAEMAYGYGNSELGSGSGRILLDNLRCGGAENNLAHCSSNGWGAHNCNHEEDAGVRCTSYSDSSNSTYGNSSDATSPSTWRTTDSNLSAGCLGDIEVRLSGGYKGSDYGYGKAEVRCSFPSSDWGAVCDDRWSIDDGDVVCRSLGYRGAERIYTNSYFGQTNQQILLDDLECNGSESNLRYCRSSQWGRHNCDISEHAGVRCANYSYTRAPTSYKTKTTRRIITTSTRRPTSDCKGDIEVRLAGYNSDYRSGRVEVRCTYPYSDWGTVCDDGWSIYDADVVCRSLGFFGAQRVLSGGEHNFGKKSYGPIYLDDLDCRGGESNLRYCRNLNWGVHNCDHSEDAAVVCQDYPTTVDYYTTTSYSNVISWQYPDFRVRLANGADYSEGRVEVQRYPGDQWSTVCDDEWSYQQAQAICRELGFESAVQYVGNARFGRGSGPILYRIMCRDGDLGNCYTEGWNTNGCNHGEDAGVICSRSRLTTDYPQTNANSSFQCPDERVSFAINRMTGLAKVTIPYQIGYIDLSHRFELPPGVYPMSFPNVVDMNNYCNVTVEVYDPAVVKSLSFRARYKMACHHIDTNITRLILKARMESGFVDINDICGGDCKAIDQPIMSCENSILTVDWPTNQIYKSSVTELPSQLDSKLRQRIRAKGSFLYITVFTAVPPVVRPIPTTDGLALDVVVRKSCVSTSMQYKDLLQRCVAN